MTRSGILRHQAVKVYKQLIRLSDHYPDPSYNLAGKTRECFRSTMSRLEGIQDGTLREEELAKSISKAIFIRKEVQFNNISTPLWLIVTGTLVDPAIDDDLFLGRAGAAKVPAIIQVLGRAVLRQKAVNGPPRQQPQLDSNRRMSMNPTTCRNRVMARGAAGICRSTTWPQLGGHWDGIPPTTQPQDGKLLVVLVIIGTAFRRVTCSSDWGGPQVSL
ncbi:hypothetical protein PCANC_27465 [Puccinia coronata f. sp. avenae]|uniref:Uncharacterized protein n=1 Tax=Puccinia coronata f. sp. avenae TaxID=200324 RepID=A0A2N5S0G9_9BASI|nr:hypothetical protein PCANC_27465 [Puccinia coronata f. sp. avenae]